MEIEKLIDKLNEYAEWAESKELETPIDLSDTLKKAAETINLLHEIAVDESNKRYHRLFDNSKGEKRGRNDRAY